MLMPLNSSGIRIAIKVAQEKIVPMVFFLSKGLSGMMMDIRSNARLGQALVK